MGEASSGRPRNLIRATSRTCRTNGWSLLIKGAIPDATWRVMVRSAIKE